MKLSFAALRIDALGALAAAALTLGAGLIAMGPHVLARGPSHADQKADLARRREEAASLDKQAESAHQRHTELTARCTSSVRLQPASRVNERLVEITNLAAAGNISIVQMTPGAPGSSGTPADKASAAPPSPIDGKALIVPIKLAGAGSYPDMARFLHALREQFRDTDVTALHLSASPAAPAPAKQSENPSASFTIDLAWYAAPAASAAAIAKP